MTACEIERLSASPALCEGILWSPVDSPHIVPVMQSFDVFFVVSLNKLNEQVR